MSPTHKRPWNYEQRIQQIALLTEQHKTGEEIASQLGLSPKTVRYYAVREHVPVIFEGKNRELLPKVWKIKEALVRSQPLTLEELCRRTRLTREEVQEVSRRYRVLPFPSTIRAELRRRTKIDQLIEEGYDLKEIGAQVKLTHQRISQYIMETRQHRHWLGCRKKRMPITEKEKKEVLSILEQRIDHLAEQAGWEYQKAAEYMRKAPATLYRFQELVDLFKFYRIAKETDIKLSLRALEVEGMSYSTIEKILHAVGLEAMYGKVDKRIQEDFQLKRERIRACFDLPLLIVDIQYFAGVRHSTSVFQYLRRKGKRFRPRSSIKMFSSNRFAKGPERSLTYRLASQIYECLDAGFTVGETKEYCQTSEMIIGYAQGHRNEIQPVIVEALRRLYQENITTPHRPKYGLEHLLQQDWKDQAIARAYQRTNWNATTVAYFVDLTPSYVIQQFWKQGGGRRKKVLGSERLSKHAASQIYQLQDRGKNPQQVAQTLHIKKKRVEYALQNRQRYEPMIMEGLHKIFPDQEIITPYLPGKNL